MSLFLINSSLFHEGVWVNDSTALPFLALALGRNEHQFHAAAALPLRKKPPLPIIQILTTNKQEIKNKT
jgi:hypothetical protein